MKYRTICNDNIHQEIKHKHRKISRLLRLREQNTHLDYLLFIPNCLDDKQVPFCSLLHSSNNYRNKTSYQLSQSYDGVLGFKKA